MTISSLERNRKMTATYKKVLAEELPTEEIEEIMNFEKAKLLSLIQKADLKKVAVFCGFIDPDGMACTLAMEVILQKLGCGSITSFYKGSFNRSQNKLVRSLLNINVQPEEKFKEEDGYTCVIAVDAPAVLLPVQPDFVIDHHEQNGPSAKIGSDIRFVGATSSVMLEYLKEIGIDFNSEIGQKLATALLVGIITDTKNGTVEVTCELDYDAMAFCHKFKDPKLYKEIINYPRPTYYNDLFCQAWDNKVVEGTLLVSGIGVIPEARSGIISDLAEKFLEVEGIKTSVVFAVVEGTVDISVRSNSPINIDELLKSTFGSGGGKPNAGRARIELPLIFQNVSEQLNEELFAICGKIIKHKVIQMVGDKN